MDAFARDVISSEADFAQLVMKVSLKSSLGYRDLFGVGNWMRWG